MLPPLNTPIQHTGGATCPVHPETVTTVVYKDAACELGVIPKLARTRFWREVTAFTITARAPADRIAELEAALTDLQSELAAMQGNRDEITLKWASLQARLDAGPGAVIAPTVLYDKASFEADYPPTDTEGTKA